MSLLDKALAVMAPHDCLGCGAEGALLCRSCLVLLSALLPRCYRCHALSEGYLTCADCLRRTLLTRVRPAVIYAGLAKELIWQLKSSGAQEAAHLMAAKMAHGLVLSPSTLVVPVPTATTRVRQRGYDQAQLIAKSLGRRLHLPYAKLLIRHGQAHQVGAGRDQRLNQLDNAFRVTKTRLVRGAHILLVDDVVTTGATLEAAAGVLHAVGAARVEAVTFAQPLLWH